MPGQPPSPPARRFARGASVFVTLPAAVSAVDPPVRSGQPPVAYRVQVRSATTGGYVEVDVPDESQLALAPGSAP